MIDRFAARVSLAAISAMAVIAWGSTHYPWIAAVPVVILATALVGCLAWCAVRGPR